jgi:hypothetical protein
MALEARVSARPGAVDVEFCGQVFSRPQTDIDRGFREGGLLAFGGALALAERCE